eukprot:s2439_g9.t1
MTRDPRSYAAYGAKGQGGQRFRPPTEETAAPTWPGTAWLWHWTAGAPEPRHAGTPQVARCFHLADPTEPSQLIPTGHLEANGHQPAIMLTARLWTPSGVACTDTTYFYNSLERKGNDRGHFVSEPINTASLIESTGSWEDSAFSPRLMLICELKAKGNFYRPVAQEVCPWFAYSNDDGYLVKEAPPPPPMAPTASPPGPARDLHPLRNISGDPLHASVSAGETAPEAGVHPATVAAMLQLRRAMGEPQGMSYTELMDGITVTQALLQNIQAVVTDLAPTDTVVTGPPQADNAWPTG